MTTTEQSARSCCCGGIRPTAEPMPPIDGRFALTDHHGQQVTEQDYGDRHLLMFFGFVHCQVICPRELAKLTLALDHLGDGAQRIQPLFVTLDPERDTPEALHNHLQNRAPRFLGLTGSTQAIDETKKRFRVFSKKVVDPLAPGGYAVPHTAFAYLLKPGGGYLAHFSDTFSTTEIAERLRTHIG